MTRMSMLVAACGAVVLAVATGCSSPGGCRSCKKLAPAPARPAAPAAVAEPGSLPPARYGGQKLCPATGEELGSMGEPVAVTVAGRTVYVCCRGCAKGARAEPEKTLAAVEAERDAR